MELIEMRDEAIRVMTEFFEQNFPGRYSVTHDGDRILVTHGSRKVKVDPIGPLLMRDPRGLYEAIIRRLEPAPA